MKIYSVSVSKPNLNQKDQIILLMIPKGEVLHHLAVKLSSEFLGGMTMVIFIVGISFIPSKPKKKINSIKSIKIDIFVVL